MALQFFAVHSEALATTHDALQRHASAHGLRSPGPTRALRIAQLYGHLQLRAAGRSSVVVALSELAATWRFQPRQLRQDLALLQGLGWLNARGTSRGTVISLSGPEPADRADGDGRPAQGFSEPAAPHPAKPESPGLRVGQLDPAAPFAARPEPAAQPVPAPSPKPAPPVGSPSPPETAKAPKADESRDLLQRLAGLYNQHRPSTWPAYQPRGNGLGTKLRQALRQAGSADALADTLTAALRAMPPFWRTTYPQGRSGSECMAALSAPTGAAPAWGWSSGISSRGRRRRSSAAPNPAATGAIRPAMEGPMQSEPLRQRPIQPMGSRGPGGSSSGTAASGAARAGRLCCSANSKNASSPCCWRPAARGFPAPPSGSSSISIPIPSHLSRLSCPRPLHHRRPRWRRARLGMANRSRTTARQGEQGAALIGPSPALLPFSRPIPANRGDDDQPISSRLPTTSEQALEPPITPRLDPSRPIAFTSPSIPEQ